MSGTRHCLDCHRLMIHLNDEWRCIPCEVKQQPKDPEIERQKEQLRLTTPNRVETVRVGGDSGGGDASGGR